MPLPWTPAPRPGEWLGFWLNRTAGTYGLELAELMHWAGVRIPPQPLCTWARLGTLAPADLRILDHTTGVPEGRLQAMQRRISTMGRGTELGFCPRCVLDDGAAGRESYWRRDWIDPYITVCPIHRCRLRAVNALAVRHRRSAASTRSFMAWLVAQSRSSALAAPCAEAQSVLDLQALLHQRPRRSDRAARGISRAFIDALVRPMAFRAARSAEIRGLVNLELGCKEQTISTQGSGLLASVRDLDHRARLLAAAAQLIARPMLRSQYWRAIATHLRAHVATQYQVAREAGLEMPWPELDEYLHELLHHDKDPVAPGIG